MAEVKSTQDLLADLAAEEHETQEIVKEAAAAAAAAARDAAKAAEAHPLKNLAIVLTALGSMGGIYWRVAELGEAHATISAEVEALTTIAKETREHVAALILFKEAGGRATAGDLRIVVPCVRLRFWERLTGLRGGRDLEPPEARSLEAIERCYIDLSQLEEDLRTRD